MSDCMKNIKGCMVISHPSLLTEACNVFNITTRTPATEGNKSEIIRRISPARHASLFALQLRDAYKTNLLMHNTVIFKFR